MKETLSFLVVLIFLAGCEGEIKYESEPDRVVVHRTFVYPDSLEISIDLFIPKAVKRQMKDTDIFQHLDKAGIEYELTSTDYSRVGGDYRWYNIYANDKEYHVGFCNSRAFAYMVDGVAQ
jgi:hypothetical protein